MVLSCRRLEQGEVSFWDDASGIEPGQCGPFPVGTRVRIQSLENDPMNLSGKVGIIRWVVPGGASVEVEGEAEKFKVQDAAMVKELSVHCELVGEWALYTLHSFVSDLPTGGGVGCSSHIRTPACQ